MSPLRLDRDAADRLLEMAVANIQRDYPVHWTRLISGPEDLVPQREWHPVFAGSYDWHSCVHQTWLAARLLRAYPELPGASSARRVLSDLVTEAGCVQEAAFFASDAGQHWERPYGWAWLLTLDAELVGTPWSVSPLSSVLRDRWLSWIRDARLPVRVGTHANTAFATGLVLDAARGDSELVEACESAALRWYLGDSDYGGFEPDAADFLSPALAEADLMRRILDGPEFGQWLTAFLPDLEADRWQVLREPVQINHPSDPYGSHLAGLALSRAWGWQAVADALPSDHRYAALARDAAELHAAAGWEYVFGYGYSAEHWLGTFAVYLELGTAS
jgi:hypothetical protein